MSLWLCDPEIDKGQAGAVQEVQRVPLLEVQQEVVEGGAMFTAYKNMFGLIIQSIISSLISDKLLIRYEIMMICFW